MRKMVWGVLLLGLVALLAACGDENKEAAFPIDELPATGDAENGARLFWDGPANVPSCSSCHNVQGGDTARGPSLEGFARVAGQRVEDETAREYAFYSIVAPGRYVVDGYNNAMYGQYDERLSRQQIADLVAYLLTLE